MSKATKTLAWFLTLFLGLALIFPVSAGELEDQQKKLQDVDQQINRQKSNLDQAKKKEKTIMGQLQNIEQNIIRTESEIKTLGERISFLEDNIAKTEKDIAEMEAKLAEQSDILSERMVFIYEEGDLTYLQVLLAATDINDFLTRYDMLNLIVEQDVELIDSINKQRKALNEKKELLEASRKELLNAQQSQEEKKGILGEEREQKSVVLSSVQKEKKAYQQALEELEKASREIEAMIKKLQSSGSGAQLGSGTYTWPAPSCKKITSSYGMRYHPILKTRKLHTGMDIGASQGSTIVAADSGEVIYAGWMSGYGQVTVIDHGNGMSTLYAHQSAFLVKNGAQVSKGQAIGKVGSTGWSTGPHLHFEVRVNGSPVDPAGYVK